MFDKFLTASETSRGADVPLSQLLKAVADGRIIPAGRAGTSKNSPMLFLAGDLPAITAALRGEAVAVAGRKHACSNLQEVVAKADAFRRAASEAAE